MEIHLLRAIWPSSTAPVLDLLLDGVYSWLFLGLYSVSGRKFGASCVAGRGQAGNSERKAAGWCHQEWWGMAGLPNQTSPGAQCCLALLCLELAVCPGSPYHWTWSMEFDKGEGPGVQGFDERT